MTWRRAGFYVALWALTLGYALLGERRAPPARRPEAGRAEALVPFGADAARRLEVRAAGKRLSFERRGAEWVPAFGVDGRVPQGLIAALVSAVADVPPPRVVDPQGRDLARFGLVRPWAELTVAGGAGRSVTLELGAFNPPETAVYARRRDRPAVVLVGRNVRHYVRMLLAAAQPVRRGPLDRPSGPPPGES